MLFASVPLKLAPALVPATVLFCASAVTNRDPEAILAAVTALAAILSVVTAPFCILAVATVLSAGVVGVIAEPICIINTLEPDAGAVQNLIVSESVK